uniref:Coiled-coil domain containing 33 n=1 Tax=Apteryx owenii TaxID=8824 RepID=A0A8B9SEM1_APTOW
FCLLSYPSKTSRDEQQEARVTHASSEPTHSPTWEEEVTVEINAEDAGWEGETCGGPWKEEDGGLGGAGLISSEVCFGPRKKDPAGTSLYVTVVRKGSVIPRCEGMDYAGLEVRAEPGRRLRSGVGEAEDGPKLVAGLADRPAARPGVCLTTVAFPEPSAADFSLPRAAHRGCPQMTSPAGPAEKPTWNTSFLFQGRDGATIFSEDAALAIEYYPHKASECSPGSLLAPLGYSVLPLPPGVYRRLAAERGGLRVDGLPVQGTGLKTASGAAPAVRLCLRLVGCERPQTFLSPCSRAALPSLHPASLAKPEGAEEPLRDQQDPFWDMQETNNYRLVLERMADDILSLRQHVTSLEMENSKLRRSLTMHEDLGRMLLSDIDMRRLKDRVQQLQNELIRKNDREKDLVMLQRVHQQQQAALRKYQEKMAKMKGLEETVRQQEKVIQTMERMLEERLSGAGKGTEKPAGGCKQRRGEGAPQGGRVPVLSASSCSGPAGEALAGELYSTLLAENRKLREELARPRHPSPPIAPPPQALPVRAGSGMRARGWVGRELTPLCVSALLLVLFNLQDVFSSSEKLSLLAKLEKAQARIPPRSLSQLEEAARRWGREKQELSTRLLEQDHGFRASSSSFAHDPAAVSAWVPGLPGNGLFCPLRPGTSEASG